LRNGRRKAESIITRQLLTLDIDSVPQGEDPWPTVELVIVFSYRHFAAEVNQLNSHNHTSLTERYVNLSEPVPL